MSDVKGGNLFGKYKARCVNNQDPKGICRIQVQVPDVMGFHVSNWAMPCLPVAGFQSGFYLVPPVNAGVWVEFEQGDIDHPIWTGCFWQGREEVPVLAQTPPPLHDIVLQSVGKYSISISDKTGILLKSPGGAFIRVNDAGITISNEKGPIIQSGTIVSINGEALVVK